MAASDQPSPKKSPSFSDIAQQSPSFSDIVRVQPRGPTFMPKSAEDSGIQRRLSIFNEKQGLEDLDLDKKLKICRGC